MKRTITKSSFIEAFSNSQLRNSFSDAALSAIFDSIITEEENTGEEKELYIIDIAVRWSECDGIIDFLDEYNLSFTDVGIDEAEARSSCMETDRMTEEQESEFMDWINSHTTAVLMNNGGLVWLNF